MSWNYSRYDSALDLPGFDQQRPAPYHSQEEPFSMGTSSNISTSSMHAYPEPWSQHNPRDSDPIIPLQASVYPQALDDAAASSRSMHSLEDPFTPYTSASRYMSPETESPTNYSIPPSPSERLPWSSATTAPTSHTTTYIDDNTIGCSQCSARFTGVYRSTNLARHARLKHNPINDRPYPCPAEGCTKVFQRSDARLKHMRNKHHELVEPRVRSSEVTRYLPTPRQSESVPNTSLLYVGHWLQSEQGLVKGHAATVQQLMDPIGGVGDFPLAAHSVVQVLQLKLDPEAYIRTWSNFFSRWESIVQQLKDDQSEAFPAYFKALEDIRAAVQAADAPSGSRTAAASKKRADPHGRGASLASASRSTSQSNRVNKQSDRHRQANSSRNNPAVAVGSSRSQPAVPLVDCPIYKHEFMHRLPPSCGGCSESVMAQVRGHLNPSRNSRHRDFIVFIAQCDRCKQDFIDRREFEGHRGLQCDRRPQSRGDIMTPWVRLYLTLYPTAVRVPSPFLNDNTWLDAAIVDQCRGPFLGRGRTTNNPPPISSDQASSAISHMIHDLVNPTFIQPPQSSNPIRNRNRLSPAALQEPTVNGQTSNQHLRIVLESFNTHYRTLRQSVPHLPHHQIIEMAQECTRLHRATTEFFQQHLSEAQQNQQQGQFPPTQPPAQSQTTTAGYAQPSHASGMQYENAMGDEMLPMTPVREFAPASSADPSLYGSTVGESLATRTHRHAQAPSFSGPTVYGEDDTSSAMAPNQYSTPFTSNHNQYLNPSSSTQPSSGNRTWSSQFYDSSTTPSSTLQQEDFYYLSPGPSGYERGASLPPSSPPVMPNLRRTLPSRRSLQEGNEPFSPFMAPSDGLNDDFDDAIFMNPQPPNGQY